MEMAEIENRLATLAWAHRGDVFVVVAIEGVLDIHVLAEVRGQPHRPHHIHFEVYLLIHYLYSRTYISPLALQAIVPPGVNPLPFSRSGGY